MQIILVSLCASLIPVRDTPNIVYQPLTDDKVGRSAEMRIAFLDPKSDVTTVPTIIGKEHDVERLSDDEVQHRNAECSFHHRSFPCRSFPCIRHILKWRNNKKCLIRAGTFRSCSHLPCTIQPNHIPSNPIQSNPLRTNLTINSSIPFTFYCPTFRSGRLLLTTLSRGHCRVSTVPESSSSHRPIRAVINVPCIHHRHSKPISLQAVTISES